MNMGSYHHLIWYVAVNGNDVMLLSGVKHEVKVPVTLITTKEQSTTKYHKGLFGDLFGIFHTYGSS